MKNKILKTILLSFSLLVLGTTVSCSDDFVERKFFQEVEQSDLKTVLEVKSFVYGAYVSMRSTTYYGRDFNAYAEIRSDEMQSNGRAGHLNTVRQYNMTSNDIYAGGTYRQIYTMVAKTNIVINTDINALSGTEQDKELATYYKGQAYALRAQGFFDLLRLYGQKYTGGNLGVVLPLKYDPKAKQARATIQETEAQIESDFNTALSIMNSESSYDNPSNKVELSINAVKGLMSRYYLYKKDYAKVRSLVNDLIGQYDVIPSNLFQVSYSRNMAASAMNSIFELEVGNDAALGATSYNQIISGQGYRNLVVLPDTYSIYSDADVRKSLLTDDGTGIYLSYTDNSKNYKAGKYLERSGSDNIKMIRYEEILLNGAEAELNGGDPTKALDYYNKIITNRGLDAATSVTEDEVRLERRKELLGEGFRMWDLLRWGVDFRPSNVPIEKLAFPIPRQETDIEGTLVVSNPGYDN